MRATAAVDTLRARNGDRIARVSFPTKAEALRAFIAANMGIVERWGLDTLASGGEFDAVNERYDLRGARRVRTLRGALLAAIPPGRPYRLDRLDLDTLNDTAPAREEPFRLPDYAAMARLDARAEYLSKFDFGGDVPPQPPPMEEPDMKPEIKSLTPIWSGTIAYGAVRVPVQMWRAQPSEGAAVAMRTLHRACMAPVQRVNRCSACGEDMRADDMLTAVEVSRGEYVPMDRADMPRAAGDERTAVIVEEWVPLAQIDPLHLDRTYFLTAAEGTIKTYALLHRALLQTGAAAIVRFTMRTRENLAVVYPRGQHLVISTLHYAAELARVEDLPAGADGIPVGERDFDALVGMISTVAVTYQAERYIDREAEGARAAVAAKVAERTSVTLISTARGKRTAGGAK